MTGGRGKASGGSLGLGSVVVAILDGNWSLNGTLTLTKRTMAMTKNGLTTSLTGICLWRGVGKAEAGVGRCPGDARASGEKSVQERAAWLHAAAAASEP
jgi:hypothetical protein